MNAPQDTYDFHVKLFALELPSAGASPLGSSGGDPGDAEAVPFPQRIHTLRDGHRASVQCVALAIDGELCVSGARDGSMIVWRSSVGSALATFASNLSLLGMANA